MAPDGAETAAQQQQQEQPAAAVPPAPPAAGSLCHVCRQQPHKYRCPGCHMQTCSLACSKQHKQDSGCSGKRDKLAFVPMAEFTDKHLLSDYRWLEEVSRVDDVAKRRRPPRPRRELPQHLSGLVHQARLRGVRLLIMPPGMQRRQTNSTRYDHKARKLFWKLEWRFPGAAAAGPAAAGPAAGAAAAGAAGAAIAANGVPAAGTAVAAAAVSLTDGRVDEDALLSDVLGRHLQYSPGGGGRALALQQHRQAGCAELAVVMRKERCPANAVRYHRLDLSSSLKSQLAGKTVIEYPSLIVLLPGELAGYNILTAAEDQAEQQAAAAAAGFRRQQGFGRGGMQPPPPPPPPPRRQPPAAGEQQQQEQQGSGTDAATEEPPAKRQCSARDGAVVGGDVEPRPPPVAEQQLVQAEPADSNAGDPQQQQQQQKQQQYYYYDPADDGADEDAADFLAGLADDDGDDDDEPGQQPAGQAAAVPQPAAGAAADDDEAGRATMMQLLGQYDENEIDIDDES